MNLKIVRVVLLFVSSLFATAFPLAAQSNGILREVYLNIGSGVAVADLTNSTKFPNSPDSENIITDFFEVPQNIADNYGQRVRALITAPATGNYIFWISSDDASHLYLSSDENPANKVLVARVDTWTASREWTKEANQQSTARSLVAGQRYYIEALMKEGGGGDNLAVRWQLPSSAMEEPIPASRLMPFGVGPPSIVTQPQNQTVVEGGTANFSVQITRNFGATFQWKRNGTNIPGATASSYSLANVRLTDSPSTFSCSITNSYGGTNSSTVTLTVVPDTTRPTISTVGNLGDNQLVYVVFSEPVEAASATQASNYTINNGIGVTTAAFGIDDQTIILTTTPMAQGVTYTLTVNNVRDRASTPNTILPGSTATFRIDFAPLDISVIKPPPEPIGPSSRRTGLVITEIMYHPTNRTDLKNVEFVELFNSNPWVEEIGGYRLTGAIDYSFATNQTIAGRTYLVIAKVPADVQSVYGIAGVLGPYTNSLQNSAGTVRLLNNLGAVLLEAEYSGDPPYPAAADGSGHSLVLARPSYGERDPRAWGASDVIGGAPGTNEIVGANSYRAVVINEFLAHTDDPDLDFIELYNYSTQAVNLAGCVLTDDPLTNKFVIANGVTIPARGFISYNQTQLGFALAAEGEALYFKNPTGTRVIDAIKFDAQENGASMGRYPDGAPLFSRLETKTPGTNNTRIRIPDVVINEVMYHPISEDSDDEYIELYNRSTNAVNVGGWKIKDAVSFTIPTNTIIPAGGYLVIAKDKSQLMANYANLNSANTVGNYQGTLSNSRERIALTKPDDLVSTNGLGQLVTNTIQIVVNEVTYGSGGRWPELPDGGGSSLELIDARSDNRLAPNWAASIETNKSSWTTIQTTGLLDNGNGSADSLQIFLLGEGECLVDDVEVFTTGGNLITNPGFESGTNGWFFQGTHSKSSLENVGYSGTKSLHLRASGRGDTGANRIRTALTTGLSAGQTATLRAKVKWLSGHPEILLRLHGNWLEATGNMLTVRNLGSPGAINSVARTNVGPAITEVAHTPILPAASQPIVVSARVHDPDRLASLVLKYRVDPSITVNAVSMINNGAGLFSATIPGQASGARVAFSIQAADSFNAGTTFPNDAPRRECLVGWGESVVAGTFGTYRFWITQTNVDYWAAREKNSNEPLDATFAYGTNRVVYNMETLYSGSPFHTGGYNSPVGNACDYVLHFPADELMLGADDFVLATIGNLGSDDSFQREQAAFWIARQLGVPWLYRRYINLFVNGLRRSVGGNAVYEDTQQPNSDFVEEWAPDAGDIDLHKIEDWFEFDDAASGFSNVDASLGVFTTTGGVKKLARYRWNWRKRAVHGSANNYTNLFALVDAMNSAGPEPYTTLVERNVDVENWVRWFSVERIAGNWDSYGYNRGKNMYAFKPDNGKWTLAAWDIDFVLGSGGDPTNTAIFGGEATISRFESHPPFQRAMYRAYLEACNGPLSAGRIGPMMDAKYNGLVANGVSAASPQATKDFVAGRRAFILSQLAVVASPFDITSNSGNNFTTNNNLVTLTGRAPIDVKFIEVNGVAYAVTWTTITNWTMRVPLVSGTNALTIRGRDRWGNVITADLDTITITVTTPPALPQDYIVINEVMFKPAVPDAEYVELYNRSTNFTFDLSGWQFNGLGYAFPEGSVMLPGTFLVLAKDRAAFAVAYGASVIPFDTFSGNLQANGETITLIKPGFTPADDVVIDKLRYEDALPWPSGVAGITSSIQLVDAAQDNSRVGNWFGISPLSTNSPWRFASITNTVTGIGRLLIGLGEPGDVYVDDLAIVGGAVPGVGYNFVRNGDFETSVYDIPTVTNSYVIATNYALTTNSTAFAHSGNASLHIVATTIGTATNRLIYQNLAPAPTNQQLCALSFWYLPNTNGTNLNIRVQSSPLNLTVNFRPQGGSGPALLTPGTNNASASVLPAFPTLWLNEVQADNFSGIQDSAGDRDPWVEIYNAGTNAVSLDGLFLANNYSNLLQWAFPTGVVINAGQFKVVFVDGETNESTPSELHTSFRIASGSGSIALSRLYLGQGQVLDYLNYSAGLDHSYGSIPDGQPFNRQALYHVTPGGTNDGTFPSAIALINEWMADNTRTLADPADSDLEDWFELYNPGSNIVNLAGLFLTDTLTNKFKYEIPNGYTIAPHGYLLVWADGETGQNSPLRADLHVNFSLAKTGEAIGLFAPDGTEIDAVTFGAQISDVSQGRFPDGSTSIYAMTNPTPRTANLIFQNNQPPVLDAIGNRTVDEGTLVTFTANANDPNPGQQLAFTLDPGAPVNAMIDANTGVFSWLPGETNGGNSYPITIRVTDNGSPPLNDAKSFTVIVNETNSAPIIMTTGNKSVDEGSLLSFVVTATDSDLPAQTLMFSLDPGYPTNATINPTNGVFTWVPSEAQGPNVYSVTIRVTDNGTPPMSSSADISITVNEVNLPPVIAPITNRTAYLGEAVSFIIHATDPDLPAQTLNYSLLPGAPSAAAVNTTNGLFTWTANVTGTNSFTARVTDNGSPNLNDDETFQIIVVNDQLRISSISYSNGTVRLQWDALTGRTYRVQYKDRLSEDPWLNLMPDVTANGASAMATDTPPGTQRIYRITALP